MKSFFGYILVICIITNAAVCWASDFYLGVGTHIWGQDGNKNMQYIKKMHINSIRDEVLWDKVEIEKGKISIDSRVFNYFNRLEQSNVAPIIILAFGNQFYDGGKKPTSPEGLKAYSLFVRSVAKKFKGHPVIYEIWNEYDHSAAPSSPQSYFQLLKSASSVIKSEDPKAEILAGASTTAGIKSGWVEQLVDLGALQYADGISIHPYIHCERDKSPEAWIKFVSKISSQLQKANGGKIVPLYLTEMGWPSHNGACGTVPEEVADYLARSILLIRTIPGIKGFWWYDLKNDGSKIEEREHNFGLLDYNYVPKPAFYPLVDVAPLVINGASFKRVTALSGLVVIEITDKQGIKSFAIWSELNSETKISVSVTLVKGMSSKVHKIGSSLSDSMSKLIVGSTPLILKQNKILNIGSDKKPNQISKDRFLSNGANELIIDGTPIIITNVRALNVIGTSR